MNYVMKYFTFRHFERSLAASYLGIDNTIPCNKLENVRRLVEKILDPAREKLGSQIIVISGYRCRKLNDEIGFEFGASPTSLHLFGMAADITATTPEFNKKLYEILKTLPCSELIVHGYHSNPDRISRIHVAYQEGRGE
jgi:hypothetical protein